MTRSLQPAAAHHRHSYIKISNNLQIPEFLVIFIKIRSVPAAFREETPLSGVPALLRSDIVSLVIAATKYVASIIHYYWNRPLRICIIIYPNMHITAIEKTAFVKVSSLAMNAHLKSLALNKLEAEK